MTAQPSFRPQLRPSRFVSARALAALVAISVAASQLAAQGAPTPPAAPAAPATPASAAAPAAPSAPTTPAAPAYRATHAEAMAIGRATVRYAFAGHIDSLVETADPAARANGDIRERLTNGIAQISMQLGAERRLIGERVALVEGRVEYHRTAEYENVPVPLVFRVILGAQGTWRGFTANTEENTPVGEDVKP